MPPDFVRIMGQQDQGARRPPLVLVGMPHGRNLAAPWLHDEAVSSRPTGPDSCIIRWTNQTPDRRNSACIRPQKSTNVGIHPMRLSLSWSRSRSEAGAFEQLLAEILLGPSARAESPADIALISSQLAHRGPRWAQLGGRADVRPSSLWPLLEKSIRGSSEGLAERRSQYWRGFSRARLCSCCCTLLLQSWMLDTLSP